MYFCYDDVPMRTITHWDRAGLRRTASERSRGDNKEIRRMTGLFGSRDFFV